MKIKSSTILLLTTLLASAVTFFMVVMNKNVPEIFMLIIGGLLFASFYVGSREGKHMEKNIYWIIIVFFLLGVPLLNNFIPSKGIITAMVILSCIGTIGFILYDVIARDKRRK